MKQNAFAACEEMRGSSIPVYCPKPRRVGQLAVPDPFRSVRWQASPKSDHYDKAGAELLDIILTKGGEVAISPPFFAGSPPTRSANPVVNDARFAEEKPDPFSSSGPGTPISPRQRATGCARTKFGFKPAPVRVEGFRTHSISATA
ncbi:uncharacterized protein LOC109846106 [Asparagus officinalis]|uniref:uncharacterized protein LOC109846106 n=1 Tax=Asparagus officinalis TaxID=4686 RepID=UPI00098E01A2|nr:uncharacterized protein LOC109846106 [Asparagus officinalis]XP_020270921.1 uncharacterized protein LOC109846106 [Asparagus officinalis]